MNLNIGLSKYIACCSEILFSRANVIENCSKMNVPIRVFKSKNP